MLQDRRDSEAGRAAGDQRDRRSEAVFACERHERQDSGERGKSENRQRGQISVDGRPGDRRPDRGGDPKATSGRLMLPGRKPLTSSRNGVTQLPARATGERSARAVEDEQLLERTRDVHAADYFA